MQHPRPRLNHIFILLLLTTSPILARDPEGHFANSPLHDWFTRLSSRKGPCCSYADGKSIADVDWRSVDGHYQVRLEDPNKFPDGTENNRYIWIDVPEDAVITEPNRDGRTWVWPLYGSEGLSIRCFMPGSMS